MTMQLATLDKASINYTQIGPERGRLRPAPNVVLVHGLATNMAFWYFGVAKALAQFCRVTVIDLRGHGMSTMPKDGYTADDMAEDLRGVFSCLQIERAHLIGHSYGGLVAAAFAARNPSSVGSLVLADVRLPSVQPQLRLGGSPMARAFAARLANAGIEIDPDTPDFGIEMLTALARMRLRNEGDVDKLEGVLGGAKRVMGPRVAAKWLRLLETTTARRDFAHGSALTPHELRALNAPIYAVYGDNSPALSSGMALAGALPGCRLETIPKAGHFFPASRPRDFAFRSLKFLASQRNQARGRIPSEAPPRYVN